LIACGFGFQKKEDFLMRYKIFMLSARIGEGLRIEERTSEQAGNPEAALDFFICGLRVCIHALMSAATFTKK